MDENPYKAPRRTLLLLMVRWVFLLMVYSPLWLIGASIAAMLLEPWISSLQHR